MAQMDDLQQGFAGVAVKLYIGSQLIGYGTGISISEDHNNVYNEILGQYDPVEIIPTGRRISVAISMVRVFGKGLTALGVWPKGNNEQMIMWPSTRLEVYHIIEKKVMWVVTGARAGRRSWSIQKNTISASNVTFVGTSLFDETQIQNP